jgi:FkbM family methyltransferase
LEIYRLLGFARAAFLKFWEPWAAQHSSREPKGKFTNQTEKSRTRSFMGKLTTHLAGLYRYQKRFGKAGLSAYWTSHVSRPAEMQISLPSVKYPVFLRGTYSDVITFDQTLVWTSYLWELCKKHLADRKVQYIIDCGANIGLTTVLLKTIFPDASIVAIEPDPSNFAVLKKNADCYKGIHCINSGIWSKKTNLRVVDKFGGGANALVVEETDGEGFQAITIQDIVGDFSFPYLDLVKIDIEGSEIEVFKDCDSWLSKTRILIIELHDHCSPGSSRNFIKAMARHSFDIHLAGDALFCINKSL